MLTAPFTSAFVGCIRLTFSINSGDPPQGRTGCIPDRRDPQDPGRAHPCEGLTPVLPRCVAGGGTDRYPGRSITANAPGPNAAVESPATAPSPARSGRRFVGGVPPVSRRGWPPLDSPCLRMASRRGSPHQRRSTAHTRWAVSGAVGVGTEWSVLTVDASSVVSTPRHPPTAAGWLPRAQSRGGSSHTRSGAAVGREPGAASPTTVAAAGTDLAAVASQAAARARRRSVPTRRGRSGAGVEPF